MQWLEVSGKKECQLCGYAFKMSPLYQPDTPAGLSLAEVFLELFKLAPMILRVALAVFMWLILLPVMIWLVRSMFLNRSLDLFGLVSFNPPYFNLLFSFPRVFHASCTVPFCAMLVILCVYACGCGDVCAAWCIASGCFATTTRAI